LPLMHHAQTRKYHARSRISIDPLFSGDLPSRRVLV
jgi:hypothetical protein